MSDNQTRWRDFTSRQILVLLGAALFQCALMGTIINSTGVILAQIRTELGLSVTRVSAYYTTKNVCAALGGAVFSAMFFRSRKPVFMACSVLAVAVSAVILVLGADSWAWYLSAIVCSFAQGTSMVLTPYVLAPWFEKKAGFATGFTMAFSGIGGAIFNPITSALIRWGGWRTALLVLVGIMLTMAAVGLVMMFRYPLPERTHTDKRNAAGEHGNGSNKELMLQRFLLCSVVFLSGTVLMQFTQYISIYAQDIGYTLSVGAALTSAMMVGNTFWKLIFGMMEDTIGIWKTIIGTYIVLLAASACFVFLGTCLSALFIASFFYGAVYALVMVNVSRGSIAAYGEENSKRYVGIHISVNNAFGAVYALLIGVITDSTGSFLTIILIGMIFCAASCLCTSILAKICTKAPSV